MDVMFIKCTSFSYHASCQRSLVSFVFVLFPVYFVFIFDVIVVFLLSYLISATHPHPELWSYRKDALEGKIFFYKMCVHYSFQYISYIYIYIYILFLCIIEVVIISSKTNTSA